MEFKPRADERLGRGKGDALKFDAVDWYELMREGDKLEEYIHGHWQVLNEFDPKKRIKLVVDEWGPWYKPGSEINRRISWSR